MSRYYYLAATLPSLQFGGQAPLSRTAVIALCRRHLPEGEISILEGLTLFSPSSELSASSGSALLDAYYGWERGVRNELARLRARRLGLPSDDYLRAAAREDSITSRAAHAAFSAPSPLDGEIALERERWAFVDSLSPFQTFDFESLAGYFLKLLILERLSSFEVARGEGLYRETYAAILGTRMGR